MADYTQIALPVSLWLVKTRLYAHSMQGEINLPISFFANYHEFVIDYANSVEAVIETGNMAMLSHILDNTAPKP